MNLKGLDAFRAFVEAGSVAKAAERIKRTPPQVSRILSGLEDEVGFKVFVRSGRNLVLTEDGQEFYQHVVHVLDVRDDLERHAHFLKSGQKKTIRIIAAPIVAHALINKALARFLSDRPGIDVQLDARIRVDLENWVHQEDFDIGIVFLPLRTDRFEIRPLIEVKAVAVLHTTHSLVDNDVITFEQFVEHDVVAMDTRSLLRSHLDMLARQRGRTLRVRAEVPNGLVACQLVGANVGCSLSDPFVARSSGMTDIVLRRFEPSIPVRYGVILPRWKPRKAVVEDLIEEISRFARQQLDEPWMAPARG